MDLKKSLVLMSFLIPVSFFSCGSDDEDPAAAFDCGGNYSEFLLSEIESYTNAATPYSADPTNKTKCETYQTATNSLIDKYINAYKDCGLINYDQIKAAWEGSLTTLTCN